MSKTKAEAAEQRIAELEAILEIRRAESAPLQLGDVVKLKGQPSLPMTVVEVRVNAGHVGGPVVVAWFGPDAMERRNAFPRECLVKQPQVAA